MNGAGTMGLIVEAGWKSLLVSGAALLILWAIRRRSAAERACFAHFAMAALLLLPVLLVAGPKLEVPFLAPAPAAMEVPASTAAPASLTLPEPASTEAPTAQITEPEAPVIDTGAAALLAYGLPAALLLLLTLVAILRLFALRGRANVIVQQGWVTALAHAQRRMGIKHGTALLVSRELKSPVSWGVLRPIILLNEEALDAPIDAEAIIAHELAHVARLDWLNLLVARIVTALFWFNPLVWLLGRQSHQLREEAADDAVLRADVPCTDYAALLINAARHDGNAVLLAAHGVAPGKGSLSLRVRRILEPAMRRSPVNFVWGAGSAVAAMVIAAPLAALAPAAPASPAINMAAGAGQRLSTVTRSAHAQTIVRQDDVVVAASSLSEASTNLSMIPADAAGSSAMAAVSPSPEAIAAASASGATAGYAEALAQANPGFGRLTPDQLVALRIHGVTPDRLRAWAEAGYRRLSVDQALDMAIHGVSPDYIRALGQLGYRGVPVDELVAMRIHGITPGFISSLQSGGARLSPDDLVAMRIAGSAPPRPPRIGRAAPPPPTPPDDEDDANGADDSDDDSDAE